MYVEMRALLLTSMVTVIWFTCEANGFFQTNEKQPWAPGFSGDFSRQGSNTQLYEILANKRNELLEMAFERLGSDKYVDEMLAISWLIDLKNLVPDQKIVTKKGIQDILFEAQLGNLKWNSVTVNEPPHQGNVCQVKDSSDWMIPETDLDVDPNFPCIVVCKDQNIV